MNKFYWRFKNGKNKLITGLEYLIHQPDISSRIYWKFIPSIYKHIYNLYYSSYSCPIDPFKIVYVDPDRIQKITGRPSALQYRSSIGKVVGGDWDRKGKSNWMGTKDGEPTELRFNGMYFDNTVFYNSIYKHFKEGVEWEETEMYHILREGNSKQEVEKEMNHIDSLYTNIKNNGYKKQNVLREPKPSIYDSFGFIGELINEICVDIGREGELLFVDSKHRLAIAKVLDLKEIPVVILARHEKWMEYREEVYKKGKESDHPDLRNINLTQ